MSRGQHKAPAQFITDQHRRLLQTLPFEDRHDFVNAERGFLGRLDFNKLESANGTSIWDNDQYKFLQANAPDTANPSLWRQCQLTRIDGLFHVSECIYQVRGLDLSNVTFIEGIEGLLVIDPLTSKETAAAALGLYRKHRDPKRPVKTILYTHSHVDHFGGVRGVVTDDDLKKNNVKILAPEGFMEHAVSENVYTGVAMARRAAYMYGSALPVGPHGQIGTGLGQAVSNGQVTLIAPNVEIKRTNEKLTLDGIDMDFQMTPDSEAPSEMLIYFPQWKALCAAENATHTFHNILTLRGALVRDARSWAKYLTETIDVFGDELEVVFASHHWPTWGNKEAVEFLTTQRDIYAYVHGQTVRLINKGYNGPEIAEMITLPPALDNAWNARGYYGSINHNVKGIYQRYMGWFDANPAHLWEHIPVEKAKRYARLAGGVRNLIHDGRKAFETGDLRWAAEVVNHAVYADPDNSEARNLLADIYEQLGYGSECGIWRNFYLSGITELRQGNFGTPPRSAAQDVIRQLTPEMLFDYLAVQINGPQAWDKKLDIKIMLTDTDVSYRLRLSNGALIYSSSRRCSTEPQATLKAITKTLPALLAFGSDPVKLKTAGITVEGDLSAFATLTGLLDQGDRNFNIVVPRGVSSQRTGEMDAAGPGQRKAPTRSVL
ncbi:hypothetical protein CKM354_000609700 [Cercospora kikuchii]|uniref:Metallo-beta-lactamase domain-containing protein n=1 Tax=Cercospora kikuchii TaxID=84275 RepID=A0A9P3CH86_9PEZI|nr:uncharacterized protein CKM354_000609700 [Cercospora kikuchii]GIZ42844.1 hypothetical protein CKM354_000609700 [Cercospora kikuchii]